MQAHTTMREKVSTSVDRHPSPERKRVLASGAGGAQPRWSRDGTRIFYIAADRKLMVVDFDPGRQVASTPREIFQTRIIAPNLVSFQYDVAPDGRFLINSFPSSSLSPLTVITGWKTSQ